MKINPTRRSVSKVSARPLLQRLAERGVKQAEFARTMGYSAADVTNWKARGVPRGELPKIAAWCKLSVDAYLAEAGQPTPSGQRTFEAAALLSDYEALPEGLKEMVARKAAALRQYVDALPPFLREALKKAPNDPEQYRVWEHEIEAAASRLGLPHER